MIRDISAGSSQHGAFQTGRRDAINAGFGYLEVKCLGCNTHQPVALDIVRRGKTTHEREQYMRQCSEVRGYPPLHAEPSDGAARDHDFGERSALDVVAGRAVSIMPATLTCAISTASRRTKGSR